MPFFQSSQPAQKERRRAERLVINRITTLRAERGSPRQCMITNISQDGARLFSDDVVVPQEFDLVIADNLERRCQVVWRLGGEIGVRFLDGPLPLSTAFQR